MVFCESLIQRTQNKMPVPPLNCAGRDRPRFESKGTSIFCERERLLEHILDLGEDFALKYL
jgi:hypothetical protein